MTNATTALVDTYRRRTATTRAEPRPRLRKVGARPIGGITSAELRERRAGLGLSQEALAAAVGSSRWAIWCWETRQTPPPMLDLALRWLEHEAASER